MNTAASLNPTPAPADGKFLTIVSYGKRGEKVTTITRKQFVRFCVVLGVIFTAWMAIDNEGGRWLKRSELEARRPSMERLADEGKDAAALWLVQNGFWKENQYRLPALIAKGNAEAMFYQGSIEFWQGDKDHGMQLIEDAAERGYMPAIKFVEAEKHVLTITK